MHRWDGKNAPGHPRAALLLQNGDLYGAAAAMQIESFGEHGMPSPLPVRHWEASAPTATLPRTRGPGVDVGWRVLLCRTPSPCGRAAARPRCVGHNPSTAAPIPCAPQLPHAPYCAGNTAGATGGRHRRAVAEQCASLSLNAANGRVSYGSCWSFSTRPASPCCLTGRGACLTSPAQSSRRSPCAG